MNDTCDAGLTFFGVEVGPCGEWPAAPYVGACEHEHVRQRLLCEFHASMPELGMCRACYELQPPCAHECPIALTPATVTQ